MLKKENTGNNSWARVCDACRAAACTVYCKADSAYLCSNCDSRIHAANRLASRHERVWVCEACERAPANFLCKADAASLCTACDASIHSANPLARRHQRVPILPISVGGYGGGGRSGNEEEELMFVNMEEEIIEGEEVEDETASWLVINNEPVMKKEINVNGLLFGGDSDEYLDFVDYNNNNNNNSTNNQYVNNNNQHYDYGDNKSYGDESVVPVQCEEEEEEGGNRIQFHDFQLGFDFESSKSGYSSTNHGVPVSSMDVGMVPDSTMEEVSNICSQYSRPPKGTIDLFSNPSIQMSTLLSPRDREARVLRYREKKKTRKFEKTIRYASRKAYAETRPRIKGRFAKRSTDSQVEDEVDHMFTQTGFSIVPGF